MTPTQAVERLVRASVHLTDADLDRAWSWREYTGDGLRFALLMAHHELRDLAVTVEEERAHGATPITTAQRILGQYHDAYRDLTGALAGITEDELDAEPAPDQWSLRRIADHVLEAEASFAASMQLAVEHRRGLLAGEPTEEAWATRRAVSRAEGDRRGVLGALFESHVRILRSLVDVAEDELDTPSTFWEDTPYSVRFRMHRLEEHLRQHTVQVDKTLAGIGHPPTEAERLVRLLYQAIGRVEAALLGAPGTAAAAQERSAAFVEGLTRDVEAAV